MRMMSQKKCCKGRLNFAFAASAAVAAAATGMARSAHAQVAYSWNGSGTVWNAASDWSSTGSSSFPMSADTATFSTPGLATQSITLGANQSVSALAFNSNDVNGVTISGNTLTVGSGGITEAGAPASGKKDVLASIIAGSNIPISVTSGELSFASGTSNTFTGTITVGGTGSLVFAHDGDGTNNLGDTSNAINLNGGQLFGSGASTLAAAITGDYLASTHTITLGPSTTSVINANTSSAFDIYSTITGSGNLSLGSSVTRDLFLLSSSNNNYNGTTLLNIGALALTKANALGGSTLLTVGSAANVLATLDLDGQTITSITTPLKLNSASPTSGTPGGVTYTGVIDNSSATAASFAGAISFAGTGSTNLGGNSGNITLSGNITTSSASGLSKVGSNMLILTGVETYNGATAVSAGTLTIDASSSGSSTATIASTPSITVGANGVLHLLSSTSTTPNASPSILSLTNASATLVISGANSQVVLDLAGNLQPVQKFEIGSTFQPAGIYGSGNYFTDNGIVPTPTQSNDEGYFAGDGAITVAPEPSCFSLLVIATVGMLARRKRRSVHHRDRACA